MKKIAIALATLFAAGTSLAHAEYDRDGNYYEPYQPRAYDARPMSRSERQDFARVTESRPVYADSNRREECWNPRAGHYEERRDGGGDHKTVNGGTVAGAVVGGVVGHQFDNGSAGATLGGALIGGLIGNQVNKDRDNGGDRQDDLDYSRCRVIAQGGSGRVMGYDVHYNYQGREYVARMDHQPPQRLVVGRDIREDGQPF